MIDGVVMHYFFHIFFKNRNVTTNDAVKQLIEAVTEIWLELGIPMKIVGCIQNNFQNF